jgi:hypothetical protein
MKRFLPNVKNKHSFLGVYKYEFLLLDKLNESYDK